jgi:hypothetical protein
MTNFSHILILFIPSPCPGVCATFGPQ